jgi:hypothetical protein
VRNELLRLEFEPYQHANHWNEGDDLTDTPKSEEKTPQHLANLSFLGLMFFLVAPAFWSAADNRMQMEEDAAD